MLTTLRIKNLALVSELTLELQPGYNVITGETGAGKSILIGALELVLGERADRTLIRSGSDSCSVEAAFDVSKLKLPLASFLEENGLEPSGDHQLVLKRTFTGAGANRQFVNGSPTTLNILAKLGEWLVDIHGPHEHQSLVHAGRQLDILDAFGRLDPDREAFAALVRQRAALEAEKTALVVDEKTYAQQLELLRHQRDEIATARLDPVEEAQVEQEYRRAGNAAKLLQVGQAAMDLLSGADASILTQAGALGRALQDLQRTDPAVGEWVATHEQIVSELNELQGGLSRYLDRVDIEPARLQQLEERLNLIQSLKRKYGNTLAGVIAFGEEAGRKLAALEQRDSELTRLNSELHRLEKEAWAAGQALSAKRRKLIPQLAKNVSRQLAELGFKQSRFDVLLTAQPAPVADSGPGSGPQTSAHFSLSGLDSVEFLFAPNPGEPPRPLRAIASSGELARVMLGLKTVLAAQDQIPVLIFDEIDANVGGETANVIGEKMRRLADHRQILCITHLPQVAASATAHFVATKRTEAGRTLSEITPLAKPARVTELARMLGGQTDAARRHAEALLQ